MHDTWPNKTTDALGGKARGGETRGTGRLKLVIPSTENDIVASSTGAGHTNVAVTEPSRSESSKSDPFDEITAKKRNT